MTNEQWDKYSGGVDGQHLDVKIDGGVKGSTFSGRKVKTATGGRT